MGRRASAAERERGERIQAAAASAARRYRPAVGRKLDGEQREATISETVVELYAEGAEGADLERRALRVFSRIADRDRKRRERAAARGPVEIEPGRKPRAPRRHVAAGYDKGAHGLKRSASHPDVMALTAWRFSTDDPLDALAYSTIAGFVGSLADAFAAPVRRRRVSCLAMRRARDAFEAIMGYPAEEHVARVEQGRIAMALESIVSTWPQPRARDAIKSWGLPAWLTVKRLAEATVATQLRGGRSGGGRGRKGALSPEAMALRLVNEERKRLGLRRLKPLPKLGA